MNAKSQRRRAARIALGVAASTCLVGGPALARNEQQQPSGQGQVNQKEQGNSRVDHAGAASSTAAATPNQRAASMDRDALRLIHALSHTEARSAEMTDRYARSPEVKSFASQQASAMHNLDDQTMALATQNHLEDIERAHADALKPANDRVPAEIANARKAAQTSDQAALADDVRRHDMELRELAGLRSQIGDPDTAKLVDDTINRFQSDRNQAQALMGQLPPAQTPTPTP